MPAQDKKGFAVVTIKFLIIIIYQIIFVFVVRKLDIIIDEESYNIIYLWAEIGLGFVEVLLLIVIFRKSLTASFSRFKDSLIYNAVSIITVFCIYLISILCISIFFLIDARIDNQETVNALNSTNSILHGIISIFFAPFVEEIFFRGILFQYFLKKNTVLAFIVINMAFALAHTWLQIIFVGINESWKAILLYFIISSIITLLYTWRKNIWCVIFLHMCINTFSFIMMNI